MKKVICIKEILLAPHLILIKKILKEGGVIIFPTETVYGIFVNGENEKAIRRLYQIKKREKEKPLAIYLKEKAEIKKFAENISCKAKKVIKALLPGPLTMILKAKNNLNINDNLMANGMIGLRISSHKILQQLLFDSKIFFVGSSANISGENPATLVKDISSEILKEVDLVIDAGCGEYGKESTIITFENDKVRILREGVISSSMILKLLE